MTRLSDLFRSPALARLLLHFALHPDRALHFRALRNHTGLGIRSLQRELERLRDLGLVRREERGRRVFYIASVDHPAWKPIRQLVTRYADPVEVLRDALAGVEGIESAFVFGSFARGDDQPHSDVDAAVIGEDIDPAAVGRAGLDASVLLERDVNILRHSRDSLSQRRGLGSLLARSVLEGPKRWIVGEEREAWKGS